MDRTRRQLPVNRAALLALCVCAIMAPVPAAFADGSAEAGNASVVRTIRDPHTGLCWIVTREAGATGGPGRMVQAVDKECTSKPLKQNIKQNAETEYNLQTPAIRPGDRLVVEENSARVEARLSAIALAAAKVGSSFNVRLAIGGKTLRVIALGPGRAAIVPEMETER
jgi:hypothetical protein